MSVCGTPASAPRNFLVFAGVPQVSRKTFWRLRESRKSHEKLFGVCGSSASLSKNFLAFAGVPQVPRKTFWCLRESRKSLEKNFGVCGSPASLTKNFLVFAGAPQTFRQIPRNLRGSIFRPAGQGNYTPTKYLMRSRISDAFLFSYNNRGNLIQRLPRLL